MLGEVAVHISGNKLTRETGILAINLGNINIIQRTNTKYVIIKPSKSGTATKSGIKIRWKYFFLNIDMVQISIIKKKKKLKTLGLLGKRGRVRELAHSLIRISEIFLG